MKDFLLRLYVYSLLVVFVGVVFHAPLSVWLGVQFPAGELLIKAWKEIILMGLLPIGVYLAWQQGILRTLLSDKLMVAIGSYALLHLILAAVFRPDTLPLVSGMMIDLRYLLFFVLVYVALRLAPQYWQYFLVGGVVAAVCSLVFAVLQVFVLPPDFLTILGYGKDTIASHLYVDNNPAYVRINGTLRGPNPLGVYALMVLSLVGAYVSKNKSWVKHRWQVLLIALLSIGGGVALWASYSRSALVAAGVSIAVVMLMTLGRKVPVKVWSAGVVILIIILSGVIFAARDSHFVQHVIFHDDPQGGGVVTSNEEHATSLQVGIERMVAQPLGAGPGSTGSASLYGDTPLIIENQYLFVAHESGWLGLVLFVGIFVVVLIRLWRAPRSWLTIGVLASGIGIAAIGVLQPVWADDTVSIVWWGLAAIALAAPLRLTVQENKR